MYDSQINRINIFKRYLSCTDNSVKAPYLDLTDIEDMFHEMIKVGDYQTSKSLLEYAKFLHPDESSISDLHIEWLLDQGLAEKALALLQQRDNYDDPLVLTYFISAYAQLGEKGLADSYAERTCSMPNFNPKDGYYNIAVSFQEAQLFEDALRYFLLARRYENSNDILLDIANCYLQLSDYDHALHYVDRYISEDPFSSEAWEMKAEICLSMQNITDTINAANYAIAIDSTRRNAWHFKLTAELMQKDITAAEDSSRHILELSNDDETYSLLGGIYSEQGEHEIAMRYFTKCNPQCIEDIPLIKAYSETLLNTEHYEQLIAFLEKREGLFEQEDLLLNFLAEAYCLQKEYDKITELCQRHYHLLTARLCMMSLYNGTGKPQKALEIARDNKDFEPNLPNMLLAAEAAWLDGQPELCRSYLSNAQELDDEWRDEARVINSDMVDTLFPAEELSQIEREH